MARKKVSKAEHIRQTLASIGKDAAPKDVMATLATKKIKVSAAQVSNVKASLKGGKKKGRRGRPATNGAVTVDDLMTAKKFVDQLGVEKAQAAIAALARLQ